MYRIHALPNGTCKVAGHHAFYGGDPQEVYPFGLFIWLIEGGQQPMLVDAGLKHVEEMNRGAAHVLAEPIKQRPDETARAQLARHGLGPEDIGAVFITHLHFDHVDELDSYVNARIVVSARGLAAATANPGWVGSWAPGKTLEGLTRDWSDRVMAVDDTEVVEGIRVMWVGGHTPCSQAVQVSTRLGPVMLCGDTVALLAQVEQDRPMGIYSDLEECRRALARLKATAAILVPGHDIGVFERFPGGVIG